MILDWLADELVMTIAVCAPGDVGRYLLCASLSFAPKGDSTRRITFTQAVVIVEKQCSQNFIVR
jgi:hypothetical protein